jgi:hypothetical protein
MNPLAVSSGLAASTFVRFTDVGRGSLSDFSSGRSPVCRPLQRLSGLHRGAQAAAWPAPAGLTVIG